MLIADLLTCISDGRVHGGMHVVANVVHAHVCVRGWVPKHTWVKHSNFECLFGQTHMHVCLAGHEFLSLITCILMGK